MKPSDKKIADAEKQFAVSRERTLDAISALRLTFKSRLSQPSNLLWAAGLGVLIGKFVLGKKKPRKAPPARRRNDLAASGIAAGLMARLNWKFFTGAALKMWLSRKRAAPFRPVHMQAEPPPPAVPLRSRPPAGSTPRSAGDTLH
jgi:hypothetical protein